MSAATEAESAEGQARRLEGVYEGVAGIMGQIDMVQSARVVPSENEWTVMQILGHIVEIIPYWLDLFHKIIAATGEQHHFGRSLDAPERLAAIQRPDTETPGDLLILLHDEVRAAVKEIRRMTPAERGRIGVYKDGQEMPVSDIVEVFIVAHAEDHLAQMRTTLGT